MPNKYQWSNNKHAKTIPHNICVSWMAFIKPTQIQLFWCDYHPREGDSCHFGKDMKGLHTK
jgi:hypothetical protein